MIRLMTIDDIPQLAVLYKKFWNEQSNVDKMREQFRKLQQRDTHIFLSAADGDQLVGSVMGVICEELYGECRPFLVVENMIVAASHRRTGVGKKLLAELERLARERRCTQMILVTETDRADACGFYESAGFHPSANKGYKKKL